MKKIAIMQPYFLPYIGYWQLIGAVDEFVLYDNIEYTKKGWFNRNRIINNGQDRLITIPIKNESDFLKVNERHLSDNSHQEIQRIIRIIEATYRKSPYFDEAFPIIKKCLEYPELNLFKYIFHSIEVIGEYIGISTKITLSSSVQIDHSLKAEEKVLAICRFLNATTYINAIGGRELYNPDQFLTEGIELKFIKSKDIKYKQFDNEFVPWLSIIDVMMFNDKSSIKKLTQEYDLI